MKIVKKIDPIKKTKLEPVITPSSKYKEIKKNPTAIFTAYADVRFYLDDIDRGSPWCIMGYSYTYNDRKKFSVKLMDSYAIYTMDEIEEWIKFLNKCHLPIKFDKEKREIILEVADFPTYPQLITGFTAVRYAYQYRDDEYRSVPEAALSIKNELGDKVTELDALQLACYKCIKGDYLDSLHTLYTYPCKLVSEEKFLKTYLGNKGANQCFHGADVNKTWEQLHVIAQDINALLTELK